MPLPPDNGLRNLVLVLGDQLDPRSAALDDFDPRRDQIWMAEVPGEATHVWSSKPRIALFLSAMRHFRDARREDGFEVDYTEIDTQENQGTLAGQLQHAFLRKKPKRVVTVRPGEFRLCEALRGLCEASGVEWEERPDRHFYDTPEAFGGYAEKCRSLRLEFYYRIMRKRHRVLLDSQGKPEGGVWNFDRENRDSFGSEAPPRCPDPLCFKPDRVTREVIALVERRFRGHPGRLDAFDWPVTPVEAEAALEDFIVHRLSLFGQYQDAMWSGEPFLYHARISGSLNLKLLDPRRAVQAAEQAYRNGRAPLAAVEGFIRQILGWREYVRGVYWHLMPEYGESNALGAERGLPEFYWTGETSYACLRESIGQTLDRGYAHHIQRLMVTGLYAMLLGVSPRAVHEWYLAVYIDAVEWVELPNVLGMSQYADGGVMGSKPYAATGKYIQRMSNYCASCPANPDQASGENACPFTTLYWDFLIRNEGLLRSVARMRLQLRNLDRLSATRKAELRQAAEKVFADPAGLRQFPHACQPGELPFQKA